MEKVVAYFVRRKIDLAINIPGTKHWNMPMESPGFKVYKGSKNAIEVVVRNNDRKAINLGLTSLIMTISNPESSQVIWQKPLMVIDPLQGSAVLILDRSDTDDWPLTFYRWSVSLQNVDTTQTILYVDQNEGGYGYFELIEGPVIGPTDSIVCTNFHGALNYFYSDNFPGNTQVSNHDFSAITLAIYMTNFTGLFYIQGNIDIDAPPPDSSGLIPGNNWFAIQINGSDSIPVNSFSGILPITFEASLAWVRVMYYVDPLNSIDPVNPGTVDQIMFRT